MSTFSSFFRSSRIVLALVLALVLQPVAVLRSAEPGLVCDAADALARCTLTVNDGLAFEAMAGNVSEPAQGSGFHMVGDVTLRTALDDFQLFDSDLVFETQTEGSLPFELYGTARVPLTNLPVIGDYVDIAPMAAIGLVTRETLKELLETEDNPLPLAENPSKEDPTVLEEPTYLFLFFESGLTLDLPLAELLGLNTDEGANDPFEYNLPNRNFTMVFDPKEPYFFMSSAARELGMDLFEVARNGVRQTHERYKAWQEQQKELEDSERAADDDADAKDGSDPSAESGEGDDSQKTGTDSDAEGNDKDKDNRSGPELGGIAFSWKGGIPFKPATTWGLPENVGEFKGNLYVETEIPLGYGVSIDGKIVTRMSDEGWELGGNGDISWGVELGPIGLNIGLGDGSAGYKLSRDHAYLYLSGILSPDDSFLPEWIPIVPRTEAEVAAFIDSQRLEDTKVLAKGRFDLDASGLGALSGLDLNELFVREGELAIGRQGVFLRGRTASSIHPDLVFAGEIEVEAFISAENLADSYIQLTGDMSIGGESLGALAQARLDRSGLTVEGHFLTPVNAIHLVGSITSRGPRLEGSTSVNFGLDGITQAFSDARDAVVAAQAEVEKIDVAITHMRGVVQSERDRDAGKVRDARARVEAAQRQVSSIQSAINSKKSRISSLKKQISNKKKWAKRQPWYKKASAWASYTAYAASKNAQIAAIGVEIGALEASKATANAALLAAREVLKGVEAGVDTFPVDADPRIAALFVSRGTAMAALKAAEVALGSVPKLEGDFRGEIVLTLDWTGLRGTVEASFEGVEVLSGRVVLGLDPVACIDVAGIGEVCAPF